jgi:shikimate kinase
MGSGKTSLGKKLAKELNYTFVDLDEYIEAKEEQSIEAIFKIKGEPYFRGIETQYLNEILAIKEQRYVLSLGGGTMQFKPNAEVLLDRTFLVYLKFHPKVLKDRLENAKTVRPLITGLKGEDLEVFITKHLNEREQNYNNAHCVLDNVMDIKERIRLLIESYYQFK